MLLKSKETGNSVLKRQPIHEVQFILFLNSKVNTVQLNINLKLVYTILICFPLIFTFYLHVILHAIEMTCQCTKITQGNLVNVSLITRASNIDQHKPYLKILYNAYALLLMDSMIIRWIISTW